MVDEIYTFSVYSWDDMKVPFLPLIKNLSFERKVICESLNRYAIELKMPIQFRDGGDLSKELNRRIILTKKDYGFDPKKAGWIMNESAFNGDLNPVCRAVQSQWDYNRFLLLTGYNNDFFWLSNIMGYDKFDHEFSVFSLVKLKKTSEKVLYRDAVGLIAAEFISEVFQIYAGSYDHGDKCIKALPDSSDIKKFVERVSRDPIRKRVPYCELCQEKLKAKIKYLDMYYQRRRI